MSRRPIGTSSGRWIQSSCTKWPGGRHAGTQSRGPAHRWPMSRALAARCSSKSAKNRYGPVSRSQPSLPLCDSHWTSTSTTCGAGPAPKPPTRGYWRGDPRPRRRSAAALFASRHRSRSLKGLHGCHAPLIGRRDSASRTGELLLPRRERAGSALRVLRWRVWCS